MTTLEQFAQIAAAGNDSFWGFLDLHDILNLSVCARATAGLLVPQKSLNRLITQDPRLCRIGGLKLSFPSELSTGLLRRVLNRLTSCREATILIDDRRGRIVLDIGSAFHDAEAHLVEASPVNNDDEEEDNENAQIFKQLEITSFDEYDDFNPRHPLPRDRAHRRGDSYFNSDIEMVVGEIGAMDLSSVARQALTAEDDDDDKGGAQTLRPMSGGIAAADRPPLPPTQAKVSAKDRILSKTRNNIPGRSKPAAASRGNDDDDDDN